MGQAKKRGTKKERIAMAIAGRIGAVEKCSTCYFRQPKMRGGGWCYMFKEIMKDCACHREIPEGKNSGPSK